MKLQNWKIVIDIEFYSKEAKIELYKEAKAL